MKIVSSWHKNLSRTAARFGDDRRGNFAIMFALSAFAVITAGGMAVDTSRLFAAHSKLTNAADAAVLATTRDLTTGVIDEADAKAAVENFFAANVDENDVSGAALIVDAVNVDKSSKTVELLAHVNLPLTIGQIVGVKEQKVAVASKASYSDTKVEVAMSLDLTGSMNSKISGTSEKKIDALIEAAGDAVKALIPNATAGKRVRVGLVPYAASVDASPVLSKINYTGTSTGCIVERTNAARYDDTFANAANPVTGISSYCPGSKIVPLSGNAVTLTNTIKNFKTGGVTAGHVGIAWAQYMLSSNWNAAWPMGSDAAPKTDKQTRKFAVIMTDGEFNTFMSSGQANTALGKKMSREYALGLCDEMKKGGISVFTIAFDAGSEAETLMAACATPNSGSNVYAYNASDKAQLKGAFNAITRNIQKLVLVN